MADTIKKARDGKVLLALESTDGFPAVQLAGRVLGADAIRTAPAELLSASPLEGDLIVACVAGSPAGKAAAHALGVRPPRLPSNGYRIQHCKHRAGSALLIAGGDLFGMLAGLSDVLARSELTRRGLLYRGGDRTEKPAFPLRYYWTWDHSTNWVLDEEGNQFSGCSNLYLKRPETYIEDYKRLIDNCVAMRFNGIVIWGFLRDAHGGEDYSHQIAAYAAQRGVAIMPGVGTTGYGGVYYEGRHPCNLETYLAAHPERGNTGQDGRLSTRESSPYYPENQEWIRDSIEWLYRSFPIGGVNLENSDLMVDHSAAGRRGRKKIKSNEADYFKDQFFAYKAALDTTHRLAPHGWNTYATYSGFGSGEDVSNAGADMGAVPYFAKRMPPSAIAQWTLTGMVSAQPPTFREWLDDPAPRKLYKNPRWPRGLCPPTPRSAGFLHQASPWNTRYRRSMVGLKPFAEACLRSKEAGLEGISVHGEVTSRTLPWKLNYLTMRHWTYHPRSSLRAFAHAELAPLLGGAKEADDYVEAMCLIEEGKDEAAWKLVEPRYRKAFPRNVGGPGDLGVFRMWEGLLECANLRRGDQALSGGVTDIC